MAVRITEVETALQIVTTIQNYEKNRGGTIPAVTLAARLEMVHDILDNEIKRARRPANQ
jgi:hypothetical protein